MTVSQLIEWLKEANNQDAIVEFHNGLFDETANVWEVDDREHGKVKITLGA